ncbi:MAG TPA: gamma-glutamyltransferase family protein [Hyphomicrobiaceae bacterium]|nr:gamma-glutamyltransferase family protein [Hyphomicrobiaceae bacterium]
MANINPGPFTTRPEIAGTFGVVASTHWIATAVGMALLERGGNAFDAGVAAAFALQVVEPHLNGPGGDVPVMVFDRERGKPQVICGQGTAPAGASIAHYRDHLGLDLVPGTGLLAACIPGTFPTYMLILERYGTMRLRDVLEPAIGYAREGYPLVGRIPETIAAVAELFRVHWPTSAAVYLPGGRVPTAGALFRNPQQGETYARILKEAEAGGGGREAEIARARRAWAQGFVAEAIDRFCRTQEVMDTSGRRHKGVLTGEDMAGWQPTIEEPLHLDYGRYRVLKPGPWSQAPVLLQQLALLKGFDLDGIDPTSADFVHLWIECAKLAYADREAYYGDPDFAEVPIEALLSEDYNAERRRLVDPRRASMELRPGSIAGRSARLACVDAKGDTIASGAGEPTFAARRTHTGHGADDTATEPTGSTRSDTCHVDVIDRHGNMFTATPSGGWLQSSPVIPELGFPLGTRAQMFWLEEGLPSSLAPGKRPRTTLSVGMALRDGEPYLVWGTPGGDQQDQWNAQLFLRHVHCGMNLQEAIDAPAWHIEHFPSSFWPREARPGVVVVEGRLPGATIKELERRGHIVEVGGNWSEGRLSAAAVEGRMRKAAANARGMQGYAAGR